MKRIPELDGIRGVAVAAVIVHHLSHFVETRNRHDFVELALFRLLHTGWLGVDIFFVLSGFLITGIILKDRDKTSFWKDFYLHRAFRILPAFMTVFVVTLLAAHFFLPSIPISTSYIVATLCFLANWTIVNFNEMPLLTHLWSLAVEEQFYFLWPQAAKRMTAKSLFKFALILAAGSELVRIGLAFLHVNSYIIYKITPSRIDGLALGAALAASSSLPEVRNWLSRRWRVIAILAALALPAAFFALGGQLFVFDVRSQLLAIPPTIVLVAIIIHAAVEGLLPSSLSAFLAHPVMRYLGRRSYALYLIHEPLRSAVEWKLSEGYLGNVQNSAAGRAGLAISVVAISILLAEVSWRVIESPAQRLRQRLSTAQQPPAKLQTR